MSETRYTHDHEWARLEGDDSAVVGITDYAQEQLGELVFIELPETGIEIAQGDEAVVIESVKAAGEVKNPLSGQVLEVNEALTEAPETVNEDPAGAGWLYKLKIGDRSEFESLLDDNAYRDYVASLD